jgi:biopolymer transport protein ExbD
MASIGAGGSDRGGNKAVDHQIPLIPFIDLLLCCVMFLLATAVWNQLARVNANQQVPGGGNPPPAPERVAAKLVLEITRDGGYVLGSTAGDRVNIPKLGGAYDTSQLRSVLETSKRTDPTRVSIVVAPEDGVLYEDVVRAMDIAVGGDGAAQLFPDISLADNAGL